MESALLVLAAIGIGWWLLRPGTSGGKPSKLSLDPYVGVGDSVWLLGDSLGVGISKHLLAMSKSDGVDVSVTNRVGASMFWGTIQAKSPMARGHNVWLVCLGANDAALPLPSPNLKNWVKTIRDQAEANGAQVVWIIAPNGGGLPSYDKAFKTIMDIVSDVILPPHGLKFAGDGVHLYPQAYEEWAEYIWKMATSSRQVSEE